MAPKILGFDASNNSCSVAISQGDKIIAFREELNPGMQAENLLPLIEKSLQEARLSYLDIDYLAVLNGPGSFTGIRIALAAARGIVSAAEGKIKAIAVSAFETNYYRAICQVKDFDKLFVLINAYREQLYVREFDIREFEQTGGAKEPLVIDYQNIAEILAQAGKAGKVVCAGNGIAAVYDRIE